MFEPKFFFGTVEDRDDPLKMGRVRIRVDFVHPKDQTLVPTETLPWAVPMNWIQSAGVAGVGWAPVGPMVGTRVFGFWMDGDDCQVPVMIGTLAGKTGHLSFPAVSQQTPTKEKPTQEATKPDEKLGEVPSDTMGKAVAIANRLIADFGLTKTQAAGVLGNFIVESNLRPNINQGTPKITYGPPLATKASGKGYGWAQWDNIRRVEMIAFCKAKGLNVESDEANYQFLAHELRTTERRALRLLKETNDIPSATETWSSKFERAGKPHMARRIAEATKVYKLLVGSDVPVRAVGVDETAQGDETPETQVPDDQPPQEVAGTEPLVKFRGKYPYNKSFRSESGHIMEIDDTPGHERLLNYHTRGTYEEIDENGRRVVKIVGDNYTIVAQDDNLYVEGSVNIFVNGNVRASVGGDMVSTVDGDWTVQAAGDIRMKGKTINMESTGGDVNMKSAGKIAGQSASDFSMKSGGGIVQQAAGDASVKAGGKALVTSAGELSLVAGGKAYVDGTEVRWGEAGTSAPDAPSAKGAGMSVALHKEELSFVLDDDFDEEIIAQAIEDGIITKEELAEEPPADAPVAEEPKDKIPPAIVSKDDTVTDLDPRTRISTYFKLGDVSTWAAASRTKIVAQRGLTEEEIAGNLKLLAVNCLDRIKAKYPNMIITSGFRNQKNGKSQHEIGQAADMQFSGISNAGLLDVAKWIRDESGIEYDQLILEHKSYGTKNSWIHISFKKNGNRKHAFTMFNNKTLNGSALVGRA